MKHPFPDPEGTKGKLAEFILSNDRFSMGEQCAEFERRFAKVQGSEDAVLFNSGGSANLAVFQALSNMGRLERGERVGFSGLTWSTNVMPLFQLGFAPVPIDCSRSTLNVMSHNLLATLEDVDLGALFITNALGLAGDLARITEICTERGILLLEDNCEALGTEVDEGRTGNFGLASTFSFFIAHHMSTIEGGMVCTSDPDLGEMLRIVRANGWDRNLCKESQDGLRELHGVEDDLAAKYTFYDLGYNLRPTEITGFLGNHQLQNLPRIIESREKNFEFLNRASSENPDLIPLDRKGIKVVSAFAHPVLCRTPQLRQAYLGRFADQGVEVRPMIAGNIQRQPFYTKYTRRNVTLPETDFIHECGFYFGNYPELNEWDLETLDRCLRSV